MKRDLTRLLDISGEECSFLLDRALFLKKMREMKGEYQPLKGLTLGMIFEKASTRTRISFEVGMEELGGRAIFLSPTETQMGRGEPVRDTARVLSRYVHAIMIRTFSQGMVEELAHWSSVPVINGLSDLSRGSAQRCDHPVYSGAGTIRGGEIPVLTEHIRTSSYYPQLVEPR